MGWLAGKGGNGVIRWPESVMFGCWGGVNEVLMNV